MALLGCDSFDHYATAFLGSKGWTNLSQQSIAGSGRTGNCLGITENNVAGTTGSAEWPIASLSEVVWGAGYKFTNANLLTYIEVREGSTVHLHILRNTSTGVIQVFRGAVGSGVLLGSTTSAVSLSAWFHLGVQVKVHDTTGTVKVWLNGTLEINLTGQDTRNGATGVITGINYRNNRSSGSSGTDYMDDFWALDPNSGSYNTSFLGDCTVAAVFPNGNGTTSGMTGSDGNSTDNYLLVDDTTSTDGDTTYVEAANPGDKDTYACGAIPTAASVFGVQITVNARKTDVGEKKLVLVGRHLSAESDGAAQTLSTSYAIYKELRETKPSGGTWTPAQVNDSEFGVKVDT